METKDSEIANLEDKLKALQQNYAYVYHNLEQLKQEYETLIANKN